MDDELRATAERLGERDKVENQPLTDHQLLVVGRRYVVETLEPIATIDAGTFLGWVTWADDDHFSRRNIYVTELPEYEYPDLVFERARISDSWALAAWEISE